MRFHEKDHRIPQSGGFREPIRELRRLRKGREKPHSFPGGRPEPPADLPCASARNWRRARLGYISNESEALGSNRRRLAQGFAFRAPTFLTAPAKRREMGQPPVGTYNRT